MVNIFLSTICTVYFILTCCDLFTFTRFCVLASALGVAQGQSYISMSVPCRSLATLCRKTPYDNLEPGIAKLRKATRLAHQTLQEQYVCVRLASQKPGTGIFASNKTASFSNRFSANVILVNNRVGGHRSHFGDYSDSEFRGPADIKWMCDLSFKKLFV